MGSDTWAHIDGGYGSTRGRVNFGVTKHRPIVKEAYREHKASAAEKRMARLRCRLPCGHMNQHDKDYLMKSTSGLALGDNAAFCEITLTYCSARSSAIVEGPCDVQ